MKCWALVLLFLGLSLAHFARHDRVEGVYVVPGGILIAIAGAIIYFEGLKGEIIAALKGEPGKPEAAPADGPLSPAPWPLASYAKQSQSNPISNAPT